MMFLIQAQKDLYRYRVEAIKATVLKLLEKNTPDITIHFYTVFNCKNERTLWYSNMIFPTDASLGAVTVVDGQYPSVGLMEGALLMLTGEGGIRLMDFEWSEEKDVFVLTSDVGKVHIPPATIFAISSRDSTFKTDTYHPNLFLNHDDGFELRCPHQMFTHLDNDVLKYSLENPYLSINAPVAYYTLGDESNVKH